MEDEDETMRLHVDAHDHELDYLRERLDAQMQYVERQFTNLFTIDSEQGTLLDTLDYRLIHMHDRLCQQGARIRHLEHLVESLTELCNACDARLNVLMLLPGVREAIEAQQAKAH